MLFQHEICPLVALGNVCLPPDIHDSMTLHPNKDEYRVEESVGLNCKEPGKVPKPQGSYKCGRSLTWEPPLPADLHCTDGKVAYPVLSMQLCPRGAGGKI